MSLYLNRLENEYFSYLASQQKSSQRYERWLEKIENASSSIYECHQIYKKLQTRKINFRQDLFQQLIHRIISICSEFKYSSALALAEKISQAENFDLKECKEFVLAKNMQKELLKKNNEITSAFNKKFFCLTLPHPFLKLDSLIADLPDIHSLDITDKLLIMDALIKGCVVKIFKQNQPTLFFMYGLEKKNQNSLKEPQHKEKYLIHIINQIPTLLGEGNFGSVCLTYNLTSHKFKALKKYFAKKDSDEDFYIVKAQKAFERLCEGQKCPYIVTARSLENYLLMPRYDYDLEKLIAQLKTNQAFLNPVQLSHIVWDCLSGLAYIHAKNMCHQDIKPANIFVKHGEKCAIGDFNSLIGEDIDNINYLLSHTPGYTILRDYIKILKMIIEIKKGVHQINHEGYEPANLKLHSYIYNTDSILLLIRLKQQMDVAALGLVFLELITRLPSISFKKKSVFKMARLNPTTQNWLPMAYYQTAQQPLVEVEFTSVGLEATEKAKLLYGPHLINLILIMVQPLENRLTVQEVLAELRKII